MHRRYEILLPLRFNDGSAVPEHLLVETLFELRERFGAVSSETQLIQGQWQHAGTLHRDELTRLFVDVADTAENREFFLRLKQRLKVRFQQVDIWLTSYPIEVL